MNQRQAGNVLRRNAPQGEHPAFINQREASWLKGMGGSGRPTKSGLRSYATNVSYNPMDSELMGGDYNNPEIVNSALEGINRDPSGNIVNTPHDNTAEGSVSLHHDPTKETAEEYHARMTGGTGDSGMPPVPNINNPLAGAGGGMETRNNTSSSISEIDRPTHEFREKVYGAAGDVMDTPYTKYGEKRFADPSKDTTDAQEGIRDMQGVGQTEYTKAGETATGVQGTSIDPITGQSFLTGRGVDEYMSPHTSNVIKGMQDSAMRTMQMGRNQIGADSQMAGAGMGSRSAIEKGVMAGEVQRNLGQQVAGALEGSYAQASKMKEGDMKRKLETDRYNQLATGEEGRLRLAGAETGIRATDAGRKAGYEDSTMLSRVGADIEGRDQNELDFDYDEYLEGRDWDRNNVMLGSNVLSGAPVGTTTTNNNPQYRNKTTDRFGRIITGAATGWLASGGSPWGAAAGGLGGAMSRS